MLRLCEIALLEKTDRHKSTYLWGMVPALGVMVFVYPHGETKDGVKRHKLVLQPCDHAAGDWADLTASSRGGQSNDYSTTWRDGEAAPAELRRRPPRRRL